MYMYVSINSSHTNKNSNIYFNNILKTILSLQLGNYSFLKEILFIIIIFLFIYSLINDLSKQCWVTALVRSMTFIGSLNQISAIIANLKREKKEKILA